MRLTPNIKPAKAAARVTPIAIGANCFKSKGMRIYGLTFINLIIKKHITGAERVDNAAPAA